MDYQGKGRASVKPIKLSNLPEKLPLQRQPIPPVLHPSQLTSPAQVPELASPPPDTLAQSQYTRPVGEQRQVAAPALHAMTLHRQEEQRLDLERQPLQRQAAALSASLPDHAIPQALQRQVEQHRAIQAPAQPQGAGDWVTLMRAHAQSIEQKNTTIGLNTREITQLTSLQRQTAQALSQGLRQDRGPAQERYDRYAGHLLRLQRHPLTSLIPLAVMRQVSLSERPSLQRALDEATRAEALQRQQDERALQLHSIQRQLAELDEQATLPVMQRIQERRGAGNPLPAAIQRHLEQGLNHDLSRVRIHDDAEADKLSKAVKARAFTTGTDIYFQSGQFNPNTQSGLELLAHEVTHTVQQSKGQVGKGIDPDAGLENEARAMGHRLAANRSSEKRTTLRLRPKTETSAQPTVQRAPAPQPTPPQQTDWALTFGGTLAGKTVTLNLRKNGSKYHGNYQYAGQQGRLTVEGETNNPQQLTLTERTPDGKISGLFTGSITGTGKNTTYAGQWNSNATGKTFHFNFGRAQAMPGAPAPQSPPQQWQNTYQGSIGKYGIHLELQVQGSKVTGSYRYDSQGGAGIPLSGTLNGSTINLNAGNEVFTGSISTDHNVLQGTWTNGTNTLTFKVGPQSGPSPQRSTPPAPTPAPKPAGGSVNLNGSIGSYGIHMTLNVQGQSITGAYGYNSKGSGTPFALTGAADAQGNANLNAGAETFTGTLSADHKSFKGTWAGGGKTLAFSLVRGSPQNPEAGPLNTAGLRGGQLTAARAYNLHFQRLLAFHGETRIRPEVMTAIICAESGGWAGTGNRMLIRFEAHKFYSAWGAQNAQVFNQHFDFNRNPRQGWRGQRVSFDGRTWQALHPSGLTMLENNELQYRALQLAISLGSGSTEAAYSCLGMGLGQVQGFNFRDAGFDSAQAMFDNLSASEGNQVDMMFSFFRQRPVLIRGAVAENFNTVETIYNGGGQGGVYAGYMRTYTTQLRAVAQTQGVDLVTGTRR